MSIEKINIIHVTGFETDNPFLPLVGGNIANSPPSSPPIPVSPPAAPTPTTPTPANPTPTTPPPTTPSPSDGSSSALIKVDFGRSGAGDSSWNKIKANTDFNWPSASTLNKVEEKALKDAAGADSGVRISSDAQWFNSGGGNNSVSGEAAKYIFLATSPDQSAPRSYKGEVYFDGLVANGDYTVKLLASRDNNSGSLRTANYGVTGASSQSINANGNTSPATFNGKADGSGRITITVDLGSQNGAFAYLNWATLKKR